MNEKTIYNLAYKQVRNESDKGYWKTVGVLIHNHDENRLSIHLDMIFYTYLHELAPKVIKALRKSLVNNFAPASVKCVTSLK